MKWLRTYFPLFGMLDPRAFIKYEGEGEGDGGGSGGGEGDAASPFDSLSGETWANHIAEQYADDKTLNGTQSFDDMVTQFKNQNQLLGKNRLPTPDDTWTEEDWNTHFNTLGRPGASEDYSLEEGTIPEIEGYEVNDEFMADAKKTLFDAGLNQKQYQATMGHFFKWLQESTANGVEARDSQYASAVDGLKKEYGEDYDQQMARTNALISQFGDASTGTFLQESGLGNHPGFVKMMVNITEQFKDDSALGEGFNALLSGENQAKREIESLKADETFTKRLMNEMDPGHKEAVRKWHDLHKKAHPKK